MLSLPHGRQLAGDAAELGEGRVELAPPPRVSRPGRLARRSDEPLEVVGDLLARAALAPYPISTTPPGPNARTSSATAARQSGIRCRTWRATAPPNVWSAKGRPRRVGHGRSGTAGAAGLATQLRRASPARGRRRRRGPRPGTVAARSSRYPPRSRAPSPPPSSPARRRVSSALASGVIAASGRSTRRPDRTRRIRSCGATVDAPARRHARLRLVQIPSLGRPRPHPRDRPEVSASSGTCHVHEYSLRGSRSKCSPQPDLPVVRDLDHLDERPADLGHRGVEHGRRDRVHRAMPGATALASPSTSTNRSLDLGEDPRLDAAAPSRSFRSQRRPGRARGPRPSSSGSGAGPSGRRRRRRHPSENGSRVASPRTSGTASPPGLARSFAIIAVREVDPDHRRPREPAAAPPAGRSRPRSRGPVRLRRRPRSLQQLEDPLERGRIRGPRVVVVVGRPIEGLRRGHDTGTRLVASKNGSAATVAGRRSDGAATSSPVPSAMCEAGTHA